MTKESSTTTWLASGRTPQRTNGLKWFRNGAVPLAWLGLSCVLLTGIARADLKQNFGKDIVFWGGCVNTQHTMYDTPEAVYREGRERIEIFNQDGGNAVHNVQGNSPIGNVLAMFRAIKDSAK